MKIAVVSNQQSPHVVNHFGRPCPEEYAWEHIENVIRALREDGHTVEHFEGDIDLPAALCNFAPSHPRTGQPTALVFNMAYGIQGDCRYTHIPATLEMAGFPYTGASPLGHAICLDKVITKRLLRQAGIPTPTFCVVRDPQDDVGELSFPLIVKPRHESSSFGLHLVRNHDELAGVVREVVTEFQQDALVEEYIDGREFNVGLLGDARVDVFEPLELDFSRRKLALMTWSDKFHQRRDEPAKVCPANVTPGLKARLQDLALATFRACQCRDYARVDFRVGRDGRPHVLEINSMAALGLGGSYMTGAAASGLAHADVVRRIVQSVCARHKMQASEEFSLL